MQCRRPWFDSWVGKIRWRREKATHSSILAWKTPWTCIVLGVKKSGTGLSVFHFFFFFVWVSLIAQLVKNLPAIQETWIQSLGLQDPLEESMATHSSILAYRIP